MNAHATTMTFTTAPQRFAQSIVARLTAGFDALRRARRRTRLQRELQALDDHMLRDVGLSRWEIDSFVAELVGDAPATRRAITARRRR